MRQNRPRDKARPVTIALICAPARFARPSGTRLPL